MAFKAPGETSDLTVQVLALRSGKIDLAALTEFVLDFPFKAKVRTQAKGSQFDIEEDPLWGPPGTWGEVVSLYGLGQLTFEEYQALLSAYNDKLGWSADKRAAHLADAKKRRKALDAEAAAGAKQADKDAAEETERRKPLFTDDPDAPVAPPERKNPNS